MTAPEFSMQGRVALITGAGRGIGLGIAQALAGAAVAIQDIEQEVAAAEAQKIEQAGGRAVALGGDIGDLPVAQSLVDQTAGQLGGLHVLINNAAIQHTQDWTELDAAGIERELRANLIAPVLLCQAAVAVFRPQRFGRIINLGSIQQIKGNSRMLAYAMSKSALENMTRALARGLAGDGITVNLLAPGYFIDTWRNRHDFASPEEQAERGRRAAPIGRFGRPRDCAGIALLLCSEAGGYITGQSIFVDGGMSVR